jgi:hypothetical protein
MLHAVALALGLVVAQADLPNANLPGNSPTLPNSNLPGNLPTDNPIVLPNTDTSGWAVMEAQRLRDLQARDAQATSDREETMRLAAKAAEEAARARAEAAEAKQTLQNAVEQRQP